MAEGKRISDSRVERAEIVLPNDANTLGNVLGGRVMHWIDVSAAMCAARHSRRVAVTASMDEIDFHSPVKVGEFVHLVAQVNFVARTSMEVGVTVEAENPITGERRLTGQGYLTFVALDEEGRPTPVPPLRLETEEERARFEAGWARRERRLARRRSSATQETT